MKLSEGSSYKYEVSSEVYQVWSELKSLLHQIENEPRSRQATWVSFSLACKFCCPFSFSFLIQAQSIHDYKMSQSRTKRLSLNNDQACPTIFQCTIYMLRREISRYSYKNPCRQTMHYEAMHLHACCILWMCMDVRIWPHTRKNWTIQIASRQSIIELPQCIKYNTVSHINNPYLDRGFFHIL